MNSETCFSGQLRFGTGRHLVVIDGLASFLTPLVDASAAMGPCPESVAPPLSSQI